MSHKHNCKKQCCRGPTGPAGPTGSSGNSGPTGPTGPAGSLSTSSTTFTTQFTPVGGVIGVSSATITITLYRSGNIVTATIPAFSIVTGTANTLILSGATLPTGFQSSSVTYFDSIIRGSEVGNLVVPFVTSSQQIGYLNANPAVTFGAAFPDVTGLSYPAHTFSYIST